MRAPKRTAVAVAAVAALALVLSACAKSDRDNAADDPKKQTLVFGVAGDAKVLDPALASDGESLRVARQVFETLVSPEPGTAKIGPGLATSFTPDASGVVWTFKLRSGVKFHDGTDFNADAVCVNFNRWFNWTGLMQTPDVSQYWQDIFGGFAKSESKDLPPSLFKSCEAKGTDTAVITTTEVTSKFPAALALPAFSMSSPKALKDFKADAIGGAVDNITYPEYATSHPVGTGAYKFESWDKTNKVIKMVRNDDYWGTKAKIKNLQFKTVSDLAAKKQALQAGDIQGYDLVAPGDIKPLKDAGFSVLPRPAFNILYLAINQSGNPALAKPEVRQAIAYAIDKASIISAKYPPGSTPAINFFPDSLAGYNADVEKHSFDPAKAKSLLAAAGYPNGLTLKFGYPTEVVRPYMPDPKGIYELMAANLKAVGINVEPVALKWSPDYLARMQSTNDHDLHLLGWTGDYGDAYNFMGTMFERKKAEFGFDNAALFKQFKDADKIADPAKRADAYKALCKTLADFTPAVPIAHGPNSLVFASNITGVVPSPLTDERYYTAEYK